ncbi:MAG TPA: NAD(P)H-hydrate dehydratase, partial [Pyrinomonadaceae bacterium]|nr:NAD(P)H-hydrate dehydratase [Pyrinomonadaceae bacterium]
KVVTAEEMREIDRLTTEKYGIPSILLMENAAHAAARVITEKLGGSVEGKSFLILCGKGNNGGDGAALARILWTQGASVAVNLFGEISETKGDAKINFEISKKLDIDNQKFLPALLFQEYEDSSKWQKQKFNDYDLIIDAIFGTGLTKKIEGKLEKVITRVNSTQRNYKAKIFSIDIPSGINADLSESIGENIYADLTVTFTAPKPANVLPPASNFGGELLVANIGSPQELIDASPSKLFLAEREDAQNWIEKTKFSSNSHKTKRGRAFIVAGSKRMAGAAVLCANAAMRSGVGLVRVATSESAQNAVSSHAFPEIMVAALPETGEGAVSEEALDKAFELYEKMNVLAVGSGLSSTEESTRRFVRALVEKRKSPVVIDADGLNALAPFDLQGSDELPIVLTPHQGEFLKLIGAKDEEAIKDRVQAARDFAEKHHVILIFKGERNLVAAPDGRVVVVPTGNSGLGKAGSGDTLAGIVAGFVGQANAMKIDIFESIVAAVYIAGTAGDIAAERFGKRSMLASDVRECLSEAFESIEN